MVPARCDFSLVGDRRRAHDARMSDSTLPAPCFVERVPDGDDRPRRVCVDCGFVDYDRPRVIVGALVTHADRVLLCRRAIEPRRGFWTLPAGHLEPHEAATCGAIREAYEEATARIEIDGLLGVYSEPEHSQVEIVYRAHLAEAAFAAGPESLEVALFRLEELPWEELAFPADASALRDVAASASDGVALGASGAPLGGRAQLRTVA
jgi:ADP-ribose pyrophosphatase YjhB (NUDIX family)